MPLTVLGQRVLGFGVTELVVQVAQRCSVHGGDFVDQVGEAACGGYAGLQGVVRGSNLGGDTHAFRVPPHGHSQFSYGRLAGTALAEQVDGAAGSYFEEVNQHRPEASRKDHLVLLVVRVLVGLLHELHPPLRSNRAARSAFEQCEIPRSQRATKDDLAWSFPLRIHLVADDDAVLVPAERPERIDLVARLAQFIHVSFHVLLHVAFLVVERNDFVCGEGLEHLVPAGPHDVGRYFKRAPYPAFPIVPYAGTDHVHCGAVYVAYAILEVKQHVAEGNVYRESVHLLLERQSVVPHAEPRRKLQYLLLCGVGLLDEALLLRVDFDVARLLFVAELDRAGDLAEELALFAQVPVVVERCARCRWGLPAVDFPLRFRVAVARVLGGPFVHNGFPFNGVLQHAGAATPVGFELATGVTEKPDLRTVVCNARGV